MTPNFGHGGRVNFLTGSQDLSADLDIGFDGSSDVGTVIRPTVDQGDLGFRVDGESEHERAIILLSSGRWERHGQLIAGTEVRCGLRRADLAGSEHGDKVLHITSGLNVNDGDALLLAIIQDLGLLCKSITRSEGGESRMWALD